MKIGIILHPYGESKQTGLGEYIFDLTKSLIEGDKENEYIIFLKDKPKQMPIFSNKNWQIKILGFGRFWRDLGLFFAPRADVYIFNTPMMPLFFKPKKSIVIALDFAYKYFKPASIRERFNNLILSWLNQFALRRADFVVAISEATKKDVIRFFGIADDKIQVIYPGFRNICESSEFVVPPNNFAERPYFLFVGAIKERKNVRNIVSAFINFKERYKLKHKLVIAGKGSGVYFERILDSIKKAGMEKEIILTGYLKEAELIYLYKNAAVLVFPSLVEGFGFPVLESMSCGVPVITSSVSSLREVSGEAALLVNPLSVEDICQAMHRLASDENLRQELIDNGNEQIKNFSWEKSAVEWLKLIQILK